MSTETTSSPSNGWQLEADSAEAYERYLVPALMADGARQLVEIAALRSGERVLDVGCGTGIVARTAARAVGERGRIVGLDLNEGMLRVARKVGASSLPPIEWRQGSAARLDYPDSAFDVVLSQQMLQFVPDAAGALREMRRVLAPSGRLALSVCRPIEHAPGYLLLVAALRRHAGVEAAAMMRSPFPEWSMGALRQTLTAGGFTDIVIRIVVTSLRYPSAEEFLRREAAASPLAGPIASLSATARAALVAELEQALQSHVDDEGLVLPLEAYMGIARR